jgi:hypothetical protein
LQYKTPSSSGLALITPPGGTESETAKLARERFPDIKDPYEIALAERAPFRRQE